MKIVDCDFDRHGDAMLAIVNEAIASTTWVYDYVPRRREQLAGYLCERREDDFPVVVVEGEGGTLLGFATFGWFRRLPGYKYTVEHSIFVDKSQRRRGIGMTLLRRLIDEALLRDMHVLIGAIDSTNKPSIALHERMGFELCGTMRAVGYKHGRWLDALFYQLVLPTPENPLEA